MTSAAAGVGASAGRSASRLREWAPPILLFVGFLVAWELIVRVFDIDQFVLPSPVAIGVAWVTYLPELSRLRVTPSSRSSPASSSARRRASSPAPSPPGSGPCRTRSCRSPWRRAPSRSWPSRRCSTTGSASTSSKAMVAAVLCFFPVLINTVRGLTTVDPLSLELLRSYATPESLVFRKLRVPNALPYVFTALRAGGDPGDDRRDRRGVLRGTAGEPRPVHRDVLGVPRLRAVMGDRVRLRHRDRAVPRRRGRRAARHAVARTTSRLELSRYRRH